MGSGNRNIFGRFEYCASPLCPSDPLPSPKTEDNPRGANDPTANPPSPAAPAVRRKRSLCSGTPGLHFSGPLALGSVLAQAWACAVVCLAEAVTTEIDNLTLPMTFLALTIGNEVGQ